MQDILIQDSELSEEEAKAQNPATVCPEDIWRAQRVLKVNYYGFDGAEHRGQIVVHEEVSRDVEDLFRFLFEIKFPLRSVLPAADTRFRWDDERMMAADNSSGFNYRFIMGTDRLSWHAYGRAIDLNPRENPYITAKGTYPAGAVYDTSRPGTVGEEVVRFMQERGWSWGGDWKEIKDYQHFEKPPAS